MFFNFYYEYLGYVGPIPAFNNMYRNFLYAPEYVNTASLYLSDVHEELSGIIYGCTASVSGHKVIIKEGLVNCGGKIEVSETTIGVKSGESGYLIIGVDKRFRIVSSLPQEKHVVFLYLSSDGTTITIDESCRQEAVQLLKKTVSGQITNITVPQGTTRTYTINHTSEAIFIIPGYTNVSISDGFIALFLKDTETKTSFQIQVVQVDPSASPATLTYSRDGLAYHYYWYADPIQ